MKISNAIAIIALGLQGFLLHSTDAASHSPLRLRGGGDSAPSDFDIADDPGYYGFDHDHAGADEDYPDQSEFAVNFDEDEAATDFVLESSAYVQGLPGATRHGTRCRPPFPACGRGSLCMNRRGGNPICVDNNRCIPSRVRTSIRNGSRCCNNFREVVWVGYGTARIAECL